jgi:AbrB family looped-hinge helix DNA binding protein
LSGKPEVTVSGYLCRNEGSDDRDECRGAGGRIRGRFCNHVVKQHLSIGAGYFCLTYAATLQDLAMKEIVSTITSKGQVTIPAEVRRHLGLRTRDKIAFVVEPKGEVKLKVPQYPTLDTLAGAAGILP